MVRKRLEVLLVRRLPVNDVVVMQEVEALKMYQPFFCLHISMKIKYLNNLDAEFYQFADVAER